MTLKITQGADGAIVVTNVRLDGQLLDMTGWTVRGVIRDGHKDGEVVAEWHTSPGAGQGTATAGNGTAELLYTPALSGSWTWMRGVCQAKAKEPDEGDVIGRTVRIVNDDVYLDHDVID